MSLRRLGTDIARDTLALGCGGAAFGYVIHGSLAGMFRGVGAGLVMTLVIHIITNLCDYSDSLSDKEEK